MSSSMKKRRLEALERSLGAAAVPAAAPVVELAQSLPRAAPPQPRVPGVAARAPASRVCATAAVVGQGAFAGPSPRAPALPRPSCDGIDDDAAAYAPLAPDVLAGGAGCGPGVSRDSLGGRGAQLFVLSHLQGLLRGNPKMPTDTQALAGVLEGKLRHKHLQLDNPQAAPRHLRAEACGRGGAPTRALASARASRQAGLYSIPPDHRKFELYAGLHDLWCRHAATALAARPPGTSPESALGAVDLHGAFLTVISAPCPQRCGLGGILVMRTAGAMHLISPQNTLHVVPTKGSQFVLALGPHEFTIRGEALPPLPRSAAAQRAQRAGLKENAPRPLARE